MIKALTIILILIIFNTFITTASAEPPAQIIIRSEEELAEMRRMVYASDEILIDYLNRTAHSWNGITNREEVIAFLELLDFLPIPYETGMQFSSLTYYPDSEYQTFSIRFSNETGERYSFRLFAGGDRGKSAFEESLNGEQLVEIFRSQENGKQIIIYSSPTSWGSFFPMNINGHFIRAGYNPGDSSVSDVTPQNIYGSMTVSSFREAPWSTISVIFTTTDALTILRAIAGMVTLTDAQIARYDLNGDGVIDTADAVEVLSRL